MQGRTTHSHTWKLGVLLALLLALAALPAVSWAGATTFRDQYIAPFDSVAVNDCNGELVQLNGTLKISSQTVFDAHGGYHATFQLVPQNVRGVGLSSGTAYKAVGGQHDSIKISAAFAPFVSTSTSMFNLVSQGGAPNLQVKYTLHTTINANGRLTANVEKFSSKCSGKKATSPYPAP